MIFAIANAAAALIGCMFLACLCTPGTHGIKFEDQRAMFFALLLILLAIVAAIQWVTL